jgi:regulator of protease activity HflC (stomatin/prohibitin superfamily)
MDTKSEKTAIKYYTIITLFIAAFIILFLWPMIVVSVKPGEAGVLYSRLLGGTDMDRIYDEGAHFIAPWDIMYIYDTRIQEYTRSFEMLSRDGLTIEISASIRFQVIPKRLPELHKTIGPEYERIIISPSFVSSIRESIGRYRPEELYTTARQEIQDQALIEAVNEVSRLPVLINSIIIKKITLPDKINSSIEAKLSEEQETLRYVYLLQKTFLEVKRVALEAEGIRIYQAAINKGLTENFLRFEGIQATRKLAESTNAKVVVIGGRDGLPLVLNPDFASDVQPMEPVPEAQSTVPGKVLKTPDAPAPADLNSGFSFEGVDQKMVALWEKLKSSKMPESFTAPVRP